MSAAEAAVAAEAPNSGNGAAGVKDGEDDAPTRLFTFPSHQSHMLTLARMCKQNKEFTDCVIHCVEGAGASSDDGAAPAPPTASQLRAHRLVLGSASRFLRRVFDDLPPSLAESTIVVPGVRPAVVEALLDFLYSGEMRVRRSDTADLQLLIETLQIDPDLISVEEDKEKEGEEGPEVREEAKEETEESKEEEEEKWSPEKRKRKLSQEEEDESTKVKKAKEGEDEERGSSSS